jgi:exodeoxyribonuclease VII large subunit
MVLDTINDAQESIVHLTRQKLTTLNAQLLSIQEILPKLFSMVKTRQTARLETLFSQMLSTMQQKMITQQNHIEAIESRIPMVISRSIMEKRHLLEIMEEKTKSLDPTLLLQRGYSITLHQGKAVKDASALTPGDEIETRLANGIIHSKIITS